MIIQTYLISAAVSLVSVEVMSAYCNKRLKQEGYVFKEEKGHVFLINQLAFIFSSLVPGVNLIAPFRAVFGDKEKIYQEFLTSVINDKLVYKKEANEIHKDNNEVEENKLKIKHIETYHDKVNNKKIGFYRNVNEIRNTIFENSLNHHRSR